jgi:hypothetical protein
MSAVLTIQPAIINLSVNFAQILSTGIIGPAPGTGSLPYPSLIQIADQLLNTTGVAKSCDLLYAKQIAPAATPTALDFSALPDPSGTAHDWTAGRVRLLIVQVTDPTALHKVSIYGGASNGVAWLPVVANPAYASANGGVFFLYDPNSNGAATGLFLSGTSKTWDIDPGANTVTGVNILVAGSSVA